MKKTAIEDENSEMILQNNEPIFRKKILLLMKEERRRYCTHFHTYPKL